MKPKTEQAEVPRVIARCTCGAELPLPTVKCAACGKVWGQKPTRRPSERDLGIMRPERQD